jgi:DNA-3-methyladenine glycosylase I
LADGPQQAGKLRKAFSRFDAEKIAQYGARDLQRLLGDPGIIRNRLKIEAAIDNANAFLAVRKERGMFHDYIWQFVGGQPRQPRFRTHSAIPAGTKESCAMSGELRTRGFRFVGTTICYAFMQAVGMTNDHTTNCFRHDPIRRLGAGAR